MGSQLKGAPTGKQCCAATIFKEHYSRFSFCYLQESLTSADTLKVKHAFEQFCGMHGVQVQHYDANNGRFADNAFIGDVFAQRQEITYCEVNAHFQNGVAEKRIRDLQDLISMSLLHATARWPKAISLHLWPRALRTAKDVLCSTPKRPNGKSALSNRKSTSGTSVAAWASILGCCPSTLGL